MRLGIQSTPTLTWHLSVCFELTVVLQNVKNSDIVVAGFTSQFDLLKLP